MKKITFKTEKPTGRYAWVHSPNHYIKLDKIKIGSIDHESPHKIRLKVIKEDINEDGNPNCNWKWITLGKKSENLEEAKVWLNERIESLLEKYNLKID